MSHVNLDYNLQLHHRMLTGTVEAGKVTTFGSFMDNVPPNTKVIGAFFAPLSTVHISITRYGDQVFAYSETYTGQIYYDALFLVSTVTS